MDTTHDDTVHSAAAEYPVSVIIHPATEDRNRLTTAVRFFLAIPHLILVGGPVAVLSMVGWNLDDGISIGSGSGGVLGVVVGVCALIAWVAIVITARHPDGLWRLAAYYLRWRVRAVAYLMLLRDEYPPFGDDEYPSRLELAQPAGERDRLTVFFRILLALPHLFILVLLSAIWALATAVAWVAILLTGRYPETLYGLSIGIFAWSMRVEAYMLLLRDEYPPFTLRV